jgi:AcrR family transcriptional regulator
VATPARRSRISKRDAILLVAARHFAEFGYERSRWADIAEEVGLGQTGLYHYFASKSHCLFTLMADALRDHRDYFGAVRREVSDPRDVLVQSLRHVFDLGEAGVIRYAALQSEIGLLSRDYDGSPSERKMHAEARSYARDLNRDWTGFLEDAMRAEKIPRQDPYLLARAVLGLTSQPFQWYRPESRVDLAELHRAVTAHALALVYDAPRYFAEVEFGTPPAGPEKVVTGVDYLSVS